MFDAIPAFCAREVAVLRDTYGFARSYLPPLMKRERDLLASLILVAAGARRRSGKGFDTCVDAHVLAAEIVDIFALM